MTDPLKLFWWNDKPNFGDVISQHVVSYASGRPVEWARPKLCDMFALGSIIQIARRTHRAPRDDGSKPWLWGSGCMMHVRKDFKDNVNFAIMRGPITANFMGIETDVYGDPGILIADAMGEDIKKTTKIGFIPHHSHLEDESFQALVKAEKKLHLIDVREDALDVCRQIASCSHVISSSLHGLIVADSFGVANTWLDPSGIHKSPKLKFYDYAAGVQRPLPPPLKLDEVSDYIKKLPKGKISYKDGIARSKAALLANFPAELKVKT